VSAKMGRPKSDNPKATQLTVRLDDETLAKLDENAKHHQESRAASLRRGIELINQAIEK
jgi:predicted transcriptional regulator